MIHSTREVCSLEYKYIIKNLLIIVITDSSRCSRIIWKVYYWPIELLSHSILFHTNKIRYQSKQARFPRIKKTVENATPLPFQPEILYINMLYMILDWFDQAFPTIKVSKNLKFCNLTNFFRMWNLLIVEHARLGGGIWVGGVFRQKYEWGSCVYSELSYDCCLFVVFQLKKQSRGCSCSDL